jgi:hypothetical protein
MQNMSKHEETLLSGHLLNYKNSFSASLWKSNKNWIQTNGTIGFSLLVSKEIKIRWHQLQDSNYTKEYFTYLAFLVNYH